MTLLGGLTYEEFVARARNFLKNSGRFLQFAQARPDCGDVELCLDYYIGGAGYPKLVDGASVRVFPDLSARRQQGLLVNTLKRTNEWDRFLATIPSNVQLAADYNIGNFFGDEEQVPMAQVPIIPMEQVPSVVPSVVPTVVTRRPNCKIGSHRGADGVCHEVKRKSSKRKASPKRKAPKRKVSKRKSSKRKTSKRKSSSTKRK